jgi:predicted nucleic acid-binding Zn ribbon protein
MEFTEVSSIIKQISDKLGLNDDYFIIMSKWQQELGNNKIELSGFKDGVIFASAKSAVYVNDLNLRKRQIINKLNQYLGKKLIKNIKCEIK